MFVFTLLILHLIFTTMLWIYSVLQFYLARSYIQGKRKKTTHAPPLYNPLTTPKVTVQVPMYNEIYVAERVIEKVANLDYPRDKLQIQILDDSTDETQDIAAKKVTEVAARGINIQYIHRNDRTGFKAGALSAAMNQVQGEFIAILDADFAPDSDWLQKTIPYFEDASTAVVQTRWGHINKSDFLLTKIQAFLLDGHFKTEQTGRYLKSLPTRFNGSGGIWRKTCIEDAGGWSGDLLCEDLDLTYRALTKGWKFIYLEDVVIPGELPMTISSFITQQLRWMKGGNECFMKLRKIVVDSNQINLPSKFCGLIDLFRPNFKVIIFIKLIITSILANINYNFSQSFFFYFTTTAMGCSGLVLTGYYFWQSYQDKTSNKFISFICFVNRLLQSLVITIGISFNVTVAICESYFGIKSPFVRTPKFNFSGKNDLKLSKYNKKQLSVTHLIQGVLMVGLGLTLIHQIIQKNYAGIGFLFLATLGYTIVFFSIIKERIGGYSKKTRNKLPKLKDIKIEPIR